PCRAGGGGSSAVRELRHSVIDRHSTPNSICSGSIGTGGATAKSALNQARQFPVKWSHSSCAKHGPPAAREELQYEPAPHARPLRHRRAGGSLCAADEDRYSGAASCFGGAGV